MDFELTESGTIQIGEVTQESNIEFSIPFTSSDLDLKEMDVS